MSKTRELKYIFNIEGDDKFDFTIRFDENCNFIPNEEQEKPEWTKLDDLKCRNCSLNSSETPHCPVAVNLHYVVERTKDMISHKRGKIAVVSPERSYMKETDAQDGLLSLFGVIMATSGCPILSWFKPMARFHLPFASVDETMFRVLALHFVGEYFKSDGKLTLGIEKIIENYAQVEMVNEDFIKRIQARVKGDADLNAITALDLFAKLFTIEYEANFSDLKKYFQE